MSARGQKMCGAANSCQLVTEDIGARDENHGKERDRRRIVELMEEGQSSSQGVIPVIGAYQQVHRA